MLDPWIIEQIRRREEEERRRDERPQLEVPIDEDWRPSRESDADREDGDRDRGRDRSPGRDERGVVIIDFRV